MKSYQSNETVVRNSRFLAEAFPAETPEEAREILRDRKERCADCSHVVHAFVTGPDANVMGCSDDGEPPGTAGRPALEVLKNSGITNVIVTIARWFGGVKLGTGGLVRAYTESVQEVLRKAETCERVARTAFSLHVDYPLYEPVRKMLLDYQAANLEASFGKDVVLAGELDDELLPVFQARIRDLSRGRNSVRLNGGSNENAEREDHREKAGS